MASESDLQSPSVTQSMPSTAPERPFPVSQTRLRPFARHATRGWAVTPAHDPNGVTGVDQPVDERAA